MAVCPNCNGKKMVYGPPDVWELDAEWKKCPSCLGTGAVSGYWRKCDSCRGWGEVGSWVNPEHCTECNGRGVVPSRATGESGKKRRARSIRIDFD